MKTLIFDQSIDGHHLEYIHHLYCEAAKKENTHFYFILNPKFNDVKHILTWPDAKNISIDFFTDKELHNFTKNGLFVSFFLSKALNHRIKKFDASSVFLLNIISFLPFIIFFVSSKIKISGIVYLIYLYRWKKANWLMKLSDVAKYLIFSKAKCFNQIFLLNDSVAPRYLNTLYKTSVFKYLPDPIFIDTASADNVTTSRTDLDISEFQKVLLHFGALNDRKGTLEILKAIDSDIIKDINGYCFIFAGKVGTDIKVDFYKYYEENKHKCQILLFDEFCDYSFISSLCVISDLILMPYKVNEQSSGILNYAALHHKPVMGVDDGLLGKIIKRFNLGYVLKESNDRDIVDFLNNFKNKVNKSAYKYLKQNSISKFTKIIFKNE